MATRKIGYHEKRFLKIGRIPNYKHKFDICSECGWMVTCSTCGMNSCSGMTGILEDGLDCPDCKYAYAIQENVTKDDLSYITFWLHTIIKDLQEKKEN